MWPSPDSGVRVAQISNKIFVYLYIFDGTGLINGGKLPNVYTQKMIFPLLYTFVGIQ